MVNENDYKYKSMSELKKLPKEILKELSSNTYWNGMPTALAQKAQKILYQKKFHRESN